ncbi:zinc finger domain-containing protein [Mycobacteroides abscessus]|uniref:zinc finger domain-containing protein n=1 Tax=Mycobacteroides abscessus TaxID=36809 RepID=UPI000940F73C
MADHEEETGRHDRPDPYDILGADEQCPECGAGAGEKCRFENGVVKKMPHGSRWRRRAG